MPPSSPSKLQSGPHAGLGVRVAGKAVIWKARIRTWVILALAGMTAYLLSVLIGLPIDIWLGRIIGDPQALSTLSKVVLAALAMDLSKLLVLTVMGFFLARLLVVRAWIAALGITVSCYGFDAALAWVLQDFSRTWASWPALVGRVPLALLTGFVVFSLVRRTAPRQSDSRRARGPTMPHKEKEQNRKQERLQDASPQQNDDQPSDSLDFSEGKAKEQG